MGGKDNGGARTQLGTVQTGTGKVDQARNSNALLLPVGEVNP